MCSRQVSALHVVHKSTCPFTTMAMKVFKGTSLYSLQSLHSEEMNWTLCYDIGIMQSY